MPLEKTRKIAKLVAAEAMKSVPDDKTLTRADMLEALDEMFDFFEGVAKAAYSVADSLARIADDLEKRVD